MEVRSYIIKIWYEGLGKGKSKRQWHGTITSIEDGERVYFKSLDEASLYLASRLDAMSARLGWYWRLRALFPRKKPSVENTKEKQP